MKKTASRSTGPNAPRRHFTGLLLGTVAVAALAWQGSSFALGGGAEEGVRIPAPTQDVSPVAAAGKLQKAVFAGGCFWGVQGVFQHVKGVSQAVSGYAGGTAATASYPTVSSGRTGHAEAVEVSYDPAVVSYGALLQVFFSVAHNPTQLNRQGPDSGTQYRSALFPADEAQRKVAEAYIEQLQAAKVYPASIVTKLEPAGPFYAAEAYHQDFLTEHPNHGYIVAHDLPKLAELQKIFPSRFRAEPVLVKRGAT